LTAVAGAASRRAELEQRQGIALRLVGDAPEDTGRQVDALAGQQAHRIGLRERGDLVLRQPGAFEEPPTSGRMAPSSPIRLSRSRRPTNPTAAPLARSSQCKSSMTMSSGPRDAAWRNSASDAFSTARRSGAGPEPRPSATSSATRLDRGRRRRSSDSGPTSWCRPAKLTSVSYSTPPPRITSNPAVAAISAAAASKAVLPTPGSPVSSSVAPSATASSSSDPRTASSRSRPIRLLVQTLTSSTVAVLPPWLVRVSTEQNQGTCRRSARTVWIVWRFVPDGRAGSPSSPGTSRR
jgi:hypothetical protein